MEGKLHDHGNSLKKEGPSPVTDTIFLRSTEARAPSLVAAATRASGEASSSGESKKAFSVIPATDRTYDSKVKCV